MNDICFTVSRARESAMPLHVHISIVDIDAPNLFKLHTSFIYVYIYLQ